MSSATIITLFIQALFFYSNAPSPAAAVSVSAPLSVGSRSLLRSIEGDKSEKPDYGVELNATNFDSVLSGTPAVYASVEFFAHWCPACRNYKPQYEKVAKIFNGPNAAHPGVILMTRVDCALKINTNLCDKFSVGHYPTLLWGPPSKFVHGGFDPNKENGEILSIEDGRTAQRLLNWINKQTISSYHLDDQKYENDHYQKNSSDIAQIARAIYDIEEATSTAFDIIVDHKMIKSETRASLLKFLQLLVVHHPSRRCRKGTAEILVDFDNISVDKKEAESGGGKGQLKHFDICGKDIPRGYWMFCRGSKNETRGFSCGLWVLLHSLSVRVEDEESELAFTAICDFVHNFFICEECRQHFYSMCSSVSTPFKKAPDFALWLWTAHNKVNERLMKEEASLETGDPEFPKIIWPPRQLCPSCYRSKSEKDSKSQIEWDQGKVYKFLKGYYGNTLVTLYKENELLVGKRTNGLLAKDLTASTSVNTLVVPIGAGLAIAVASCAFGALACYWRQHQKSRKPRRRGTDTTN